MPEMARIGREGKDLDEREEGMRAGKRGEGRGMIGEVCQFREKFPSMVVGAGATSALVRKSWFHDLCEWLESTDAETPRIESSEMALRFGGGAVARALGESLIMVCFQGEWARPDTHVIDSVFHQFTV